MFFVSLIPNFLYRLDSVSSKQSAGSQGNRSSNRSARRECKVCPELDKFLVRGAFVKFLPEVSLDRSHSLADLGDLASASEAWDNRLRCEEVQQCRARGLPLSLDRMCATRRRCILELLQCSHKNQFNKPSTYL